MLLKAPAMKVACHMLVLLCWSSAAEEVELKQCEHADCRAGEVAGSAMLQLEGLDLRKMDGREGLDIPIPVDDSWDCTGGAQGIKGTPKLLEVFVHITDPQLGMLNQFEGDKRTDWAAEKKMFKGLVEHANKYVPKQPEGETLITPKFLFIGGDMQNFWPGEPGGEKDKNQGAPAQMGADQRAEVKAVMDEVKTLPVKYTAGNHDVGDNPVKETMELYAKEWGKEHAHQESWTDEDKGILYLQFNSQLYWSDKETLDGERTAQTKWLETELLQKGKEAKLIVVLTHIPPFMNDIGEGEGWANWKKEYRTSVLSMFPSKIRSLWVCGHFHANVMTSAEVAGQDGTHHMDIRVTSSAGTTLSWDGKDTLTAGDASTLAGMDIGTAFGEHIAPKMDEWKQAVPSKSGLRVFHVYDNHEFKSKWFTLADLDDLEKQVKL